MLEYALLHLLVGLNFHNKMYNVCFYFALANYNDILISICPSTRLKLSHFVILP